MPFDESAIDRDSFGKFSSKVGSAPGIVLGEVALDEASRQVRAAGILDGEGSFTTKSKSSSPRITCQMTDEDTVRELHDLFGGYLYGPIIRGDYKPIWAWQIQGEAAVEVMETLRPYLSSRRRDAIDTVVSTWTANREAARAKRVAIEQAAEAYLDDEGSLREVAARFGTNYENVRRELARRAATSA